MMDRKIVTVHADGGVIGPNPSKLGGTWAYCHLGEGGDRIFSDSGLVLPQLYGVDTVSNNLSEFVALLYALLPLPEGWSGTVCSDSKITLGRFFWGYACNNLPLDLVMRIGNLRSRLGKVCPVLLDGHPTKDHLMAGRGKRGHPVSEHNVFCDELCRTQSRSFLCFESSGRYRENGGRQ